MAKNAVEQVLGAFRTDLHERTGETVAQIADSVSRVLDEAGSEGAKIRRTLVRNWTSLERRPRRRYVPVLLGLVGLGVAAAYFIGRAAPASRA
jgi:hypothetical protein